MNNWVNKITDIAEDLDWSVNVNGNELEFSKYSPPGQDFNFCITADSLEEAVEKYIKENKLNIKVELDCSNTGRFVIIGNRTSKVYREI